MRTGGAPSRGLRRSLRRPLGTGLAFSIVLLQQPRTAAGVVTPSPTTPSLSPSTSPTWAPPTGAPTLQPTGPTGTPTANPTVPTSPPTVPPTGPSASPKVSPTVSPTVGPTVGPTVSPTVGPTVGPTVSPTVGPTVGPTVSTAESPTVSPTVRTAGGPTVSPTGTPTTNPTVSPTSPPTVPPTGSPSKLTVSPTGGTGSSPTASPSSSPSANPTGPTTTPTAGPTVPPTSAPSSPPSASGTVPPTGPSAPPTAPPTAAPTASGTGTPTAGLPDLPGSPPITASPTPGVQQGGPDTGSPTTSPTAVPSSGPSTVNSPTPSPTAAPTVPPTAPSGAPTATPTVTPTVNPTQSPTATPPPTGPTTAAPTGPTVTPTAAPTGLTGTPTTSPTAVDAASPTAPPTSSPTVSGTADPTATPTSSPTADGTAHPTAPPTNSPTVNGTSDPTAPPTVSPTVTGTADPTLRPTAATTVAPSAGEQTPSAAPTAAATPTPSTAPPELPSGSPTTGPPTSSPTRKPTATATEQPSPGPSVPPPSGSPTTAPPSSAPSTGPPTGAPSTGNPTGGPTKTPTASPVADPTRAPSTVPPSASPVTPPTAGPTTVPPTRAPSVTATDHPTAAPTSSPTVPPTSVPSLTPLAPPTRAPSTLHPSQTPSTSPPSGTPTAFPTAPTGSPTVSTPAPTAGPRRATRNPGRIIIRVTFAPRPAATASPIVTVAPVAAPVTPRPSAAATTGGTPPPAGSLPPVATPTTLRPTLAAVPIPSAAPTHEGPPELLWHMSLDGPYALSAARGPAAAERAARPLHEHQSDFSDPNARKVEWVPGVHLGAALLTTAVDSGVLGPTLPTSTVSSLTWMAWVMWPADAMSNPNATRVPLGQVMRYGRGMILVSSTGAVSCALAFGQTAAAGQLEVGMWHHVQCTYSFHESKRGGYKGYDEPGDAYEEEEEAGYKLEAFFDFLPRSKEEIPDAGSGLAISGRAVVGSAASVGMGGVLWDPAFYGAVDDVRVYSLPVDAAEIAGSACCINRFQPTGTRSSPNPVGWACEGMCYWDECTIPGACPSGYTCSDDHLNHPSVEFDYVCTNASGTAAPSGTSVLTLAPILLGPELPPPPGFAPWLPFGPLVRDRDSPNRINARSVREEGSDAAQLTLDLPGARFRADLLGEGQGRIREETFDNWRPMRTHAIEHGQDCKVVLQPEMASAVELLVVTERCANSTPNGIAAVHKSRPTNFVFAALRPEPGDRDPQVRVRLTAGSYQAPEGGERFIVQLMPALFESGAEWVRFCAPPSTRCAVAARITRPSTGLSFEDAREATTATVYASSAAVSALTGGPAGARAGGSMVRLSLLQRQMLCPSEGADELDLTLNPLQLSFDSGDYKDYRGALVGVIIVSGICVLLCLLAYRLRGGDDTRVGSMHSPGAKLERRNSSASLVQQGAGAAAGDDVDEPQATTTCEAARVPPPRAENRGDDTEQTHGVPAEVDVKDLPELTDDKDQVADGEADEGPAQTAALRVLVHGVDIDFRWTKHNEWAARSGHALRDEGKHWVLIAPPPGGEEVLRSRPHGGLQPHEVRGWEARTEADWEAVSRPVRTARPVEALLLKGGAAWMLIPLIFLFGAVIVASGTIAVYDSDNPDWRTLAVIVFVPLGVGLLLYSYLGARIAMAVTTCQEKSDEPWPAGKPRTWLFQFFAPTLEWAPDEGHPFAELWAELHGMCFDGYHARARYFLTFEVFLTLALGVLSVWQPPDADTCKIRAGLMFGVLCVLALAIIALRPYLAPYENLLEGFIALTETIIAGITLAAMLDDGDEDHPAAQAAASLSIFVILFVLLKFCLDTVLFLYEKAMAWHQDAAARGGGTLGMLWRRHFAGPERPDEHVEAERARTFAPSPITMSPKQGAVEQWEERQIQESPARVRPGSSPRRVMEQPRSPAARAAMDDGRPPHFEVPTAPLPGPTSPPLSGRKATCPQGVDPFQRALGGSGGSGRRASTGAGSVPAWGSPDGSPRSIKSGDQSDQLYFPSPAGEYPQGKRGQDIFSSGRGLAAPIRSPKAEFTVRPPPTFKSPRGKSPVAVKSPVRGTRSYGIVGGDGAVVGSPAGSPARDRSHPGQEGTHWYDQPQVFSPTAPAAELTDVSDHPEL
eukprot:TRINITY_DN9307_c0_g1_i4.p1 TRINITY_DN9307_c0_g1~~TRINITY_DN9307_c0_g1_i4.p1  ORF type:complete len:2150 (+),score=377.44 TRINITY_DN9307_c0_g1_i4:82-6450(+)